MSDLSSEIRANLSLEPDEFISHVSRWSQLGTWLLHLFVVFPLLGISMASANDADVGLTTAIVFAGIACLISFGSLFLLYHRRVVVTSKRVILFNGPNNGQRANPLEQIQQISSSPGVLVVQTGASLHRLIFRVPDAQELSAKIETARTGKARTIGTDISNPKSSKNNKSDAAGSPLMGIAGVAVLALVAFVIVTCSFGGDQTSELTPQTETTSAETPQSNTDARSDDVRRGRALWAMVCLFVDGGVSQERAVLEVGTLMRFKSGMTFREMHRLMEAAKFDLPKECSGVI